MTSSQITIDESMREGVMRGYGADGTLIVELHVTPIFKRVVGTEDDDREVVEWRVGKDQARRIAAVAAWQQSGHLCGGSA